MRALKRFLLTAFFVLIPFSAYAWGPLGHEVVAYIAMDQLSPKALKNINKFLTPDDDLSTISTWADQIRNYRPSTAPWHYIDLPVREAISVDDETNYCSNNDCLLNQIHIDEGVLTNRKAKKKDKVEALKFLVHFVGDIHMPLHCADDTDRGGNEKQIRFKKRKMNLHALWDHLIEKENKEDARDLATELEKDITPEEKTEWLTGSEKDWAFESYLIAKNTIYVGMQPGAQDYTSNNLGNSYYNQMRPIVNEQLRKAGIRLAHVLEGIFYK